MTEREALKIHGYIFSSESDDSNDGKSDFDEEYYALRPPPVPLRSLENRIVKIKASDFARGTIGNKKKVSGCKIPGTSTDNCIKQNAILERKNSQKRQRGARRRRAKTTKVITSTETNGANDSKGRKMGNSTTAQRFNLPIGVWHNSTHFKNKTEPLYEPTTSTAMNANQRQKYSNFQSQNISYGKEKSPYKIVGPKPTTAVFNKPNKTQQKSFVTTPAIPKNPNVTNEIKYIEPSSRQNPPTPIQEPSIKENHMEKSLPKCTATTSKNFNNSMDRNVTKMLNQEKSLEVQNLKRKEPYSYRSPPVRAVASTGAVSKSVDLKSTQNTTYVKPEMGNMSLAAGSSMGRSQTKLTTPKDKNQQTTTVQEPFTFKANPYMGESLPKCTATISKEFCSSIGRYGNEANISNREQFLEGLNLKKKAPYMNRSQPILPTGVIGSKSINLYSTENLKCRQAEVENVPSMDRSRTRTKHNITYMPKDVKSQITNNSVLEKPSKVQPSLKGRPSVDTNSPKLAREVYKGADSNRLNVHKSDETKSFDDSTTNLPIFTIPTTDLHRNHEVTHIIRPNQLVQPSIQNRPSTNAIINEPISTITTEYPIHNDEMVTTREEERSQDVNTRKNFASRIFDAVRTCFCCKVNENYSQF